MNTMQNALSELLNALGFEAMARDVLTENDSDRLATYARIIRKNTPSAFKAKASELLNMAGL